MIAGVASFTTTVVLTFGLISVLRREHVIDRPNQRSSHDDPVPRGGGFAVLLGALAGVGVMGSTVEPRFALGLMIAAWCFAAIGLVDDLTIGVTVFARLALQVLAAVATLLFLLDGMGGATAWKVVFSAGAVSWIVSFVNGFNFMDGINGISSFTAIVAGITYGLLGSRANADILEFGGIAIAGAALGFLPFNFPRARVFLGDVGSYAMGGWIAILAVIGLRANLPPEAVFAPLAIYLADTATTLLRRAVRGEAIFEAHREHAYQRLVDGGWSQRSVAVAVFAFMLVCSGVGALSLTESAAPRALGDLGIAVAVSGYLLLPSRCRVAVDR